MKLSDLRPEVVERIRSYRWDRFIEKHEGPEDWSSVLRFYDPEFVEINGYHVLLPVDRERHPNITILRCIVADNGQVLVLFLKDTTYVDDPKMEMFWAGRVAICEKIPGEEFFLTTFYHEWFMIDSPLATPGSP
ncbi:MAG: hypothetical protein ACE5LU_02515 [Anaerolineae bacterium]